MASKKISELTAAGALTGTELVEVVQGGVNKQTTAQDIADLGSGGTGIVETVVAGTNITVDDTDPANPIISASGGGGAVDSVNGATGTVVLDAGDIGNTPAGSIAATTVQAAINELDTEKAALASPTFTGTPAAPTASNGTDTTQLATTAFANAVGGPVVHSTSTLTITDAHHKKTLIFTVNCTVTIPTGLRTDLKFDAVAKSGVTLVEFDADIGVTYYAMNNYNTLRAGQAASFAMQASNVIVGVFGQSGVIEQTLLAQDSVTTSTSAADITGFTTTVEENSTYSFEGQMRVACNNTGGIKFGLVTPTGSDYCALFFGQITVSPLVTNRMILVSDGLGATAFCTVASSGFMYLKGTITLGAGESGTFKVQFASNTSTQQSTVFGVGSYLTIKKLI